MTVIVSMLTLNLNCDLRTLSRQITDLISIEWGRERENKISHVGGPDCCLAEFIVQTKYEIQQQQHFQNIIVWNGPSEMFALRPLRIDYYSGTRISAKKRVCFGDCKMKWNEKEEVIKWFNIPTLKLMNEPPKNRKHWSEQKKHTLRHTKRENINYSQCDCANNCCCCCCYNVVWLWKCFLSVLHWDFVCSYVYDVFLLCWRRRDMLRYSTHFVTEKNAPSIIFWEKCTTFIVAWLLLSFRIKHTYVCVYEVVIMMILVWYEQAKCA